MVKSYEEIIKKLLEKSNSTPKTVEEFNKLQESIIINKERNNVPCCQKKCNCYNTSIFNTSLSSPQVLIIPQNNIIGIEGYNLFFPN